MGDLDLKKAVRDCHGLQELPGGDHTRKIAKHRHLHATLDTWYLWTSRENK
ncbi:MAG: hypothetical protein GX114_05825 [Clostridiales bacterium]|nr:hypothetical protein [Clostridiales bacterium]